MQFEFNQIFKLLLKIFILIFNIDFKIFVLYEKKTMKPFQVKRSAHKDDLWESIKEVCRNKKKKKMSLNLINQIYFSPNSLILIYQKYRKRTYKRSTWHQLKPY